MENPSGGGLQALAARIFISYRRDDSSGHAGRLYDDLVERYGDDRIFIDIDTIEPGVDFSESIDRALDSCEVVLAVIGKSWVKITDGSGQRRLDSPDDYVRMELEAALARGVRVIPVRVQGAGMPSSAELPEGLAPLARRQAVELSDSRWRYDVGVLAAAVERAVAATPDREAGDLATGPVLDSSDGQAAKREQVVVSEPEATPALGGPTTLDEGGGVRKPSHLRWVAIVGAAVVVAAVIAAAVALQRGGEGEEGAGGDSGNVTTPNEPAGQAQPEPMTPQMRRIAAAQETINDRLQGLGDTTDSFAGLGDAASKLSTSIVRAQGFLAGTPNRTSRDSAVRRTVAAALAAHLRYSRALTSYSQQPRNARRAEIAIARAGAAERSYSNLARTAPALSQVTVEREDHLSLKTAAAPRVGVPSTYTGNFTSVDRLQHCFATDRFVRCGSGPSGQIVELRAGTGARYVGVASSRDNGGPSMPMGTSFRTPASSIECGSSSRGITCTDLTGSGDSFTIGDNYVNVNGVTRLP